MAWKNRNRTLALLTLAVAIPVSVWAFTTPADGGPGTGAHRMPPPQAFAVCAGKTAGEAVTITTPRGDTLAATCREIDGKLAALPARPLRGRGHRTPPVQAFAACTGKTAGETVTITTPRDRTLSATCREIDGKLAAIPDRPPRCRNFGNNRSTDR